MLGFVHVFDHPYFARGPIGPRVRVVLGPGHYSGSHRIQMDVAADLDQIVVFIDQQGLVTLLKDVPTPSVSLKETV
jgi:hypothetical protein